MALNKIDYGSDKIATHSFIEATETRHVERVAPGAGVLGSWDDTATVTATGLVSGLSADCTGRGRIVVGCLCDAALATTLKFKLVLKNSSGTIIGLSAEVSSALTEVTDGGSPAKRYGTVIVFSNDAGASSAEVYVTALPASATAIDINLAAL